MQVPAQFLSKKHPRFRVNSDNLFRCWQTNHSAFCKNAFFKSCDESESRKWKPKIGIRKEAHRGPEHWSGLAIARQVTVNPVYKMTRSSTKPTGKLKNKSKGEESSSDGQPAGMELDRQNDGLKPGTFWLTRIVYLRILAFIYLVAFLVAFHQVPKLVSSTYTKNVKLYCTCRTFIAQHSRLFVCPLWSKLRDEKKLK